MAASTVSYEPIAIIGSACRLPGDATSPSKLWDLLQRPRDVRRQFNKDELNLDKFYNTNPETAGSTCVKSQGYLISEDKRRFDAAFFGISPSEAETMDPQQRLLLETVYEMFETAGYTLGQMKGSQTAVHVGVMSDDYHDIQYRDTDVMPKYTSTGTARSILANRISYTFDLHGPSVTTDTACSSSLVALHQAAQGLQAGDASCAIVCGINLLLDIPIFIHLSQMRMLSADSQSRMWDKSANGYARGEGVTAVLLKPLSRAKQDHDPIEAVIRATGVNSDGHTPGITMPGASSQAALIRETYHRAGLNPSKDRCQFFECHGTGTQAGDPIEAQAISEAFASDGNFQEQRKFEPLHVGSIKTVIGHLEGCAGLAGVLKAILSIKNRTIPPNMLFEQLNPAIERYYGNLNVTTKPLPWPETPPGTPLRVSVNSFGFGGTNGHAIIESYEEPLNQNFPDHGSHQHVSSASIINNAIGPFVLSAHSERSLYHNVKNLLQFIVENPQVDLVTLSWTLQAKRTAHRVRTSFSAQSREALIQSMQTFVVSNEKADNGHIGIRYKPINQSEIPGVLGVFTGQGAQWASMGMELMKKCPLFLQILHKCDSILQQLQDGPQWSLVTILAEDTAVSRIGQAAISQPLCTAVQIGLYEVLRQSGVHFDAVVGHSSGEIAAVYACGIITAAAAMQIAYYRGKHAHLAGGANHEHGAMLAAGISYREAQDLCQKDEYTGRVCVAASNAPQSVTLSGDADIITLVHDALKRQDVFTRLLKVDTAYHSHHMKRCAAPYIESIRACGISVSPPKKGCWWISSVRGDTELLRGDLKTLQDTYWADNMVNPVLFNQALKSAIWHGGPFDLAIEIGPHPALKGPTEQSLISAFGRAPEYTGTLRRGAGDDVALANAAGIIWTCLGPSFVDCAGFQQAFMDNECRSPINMIKDLPPYAWDHQQAFWCESRLSARFRTSDDSVHELLGRRAATDTDRDLLWRNILTLTELPWLKGHSIRGEVFLPAAAYISLAVEAGKTLAAGMVIRLFEVQDVKIVCPVIIQDTQEGHETLFTVHLLQESDDNAKVIAAEFTFYYCPNGRNEPMVHTCTGRLLVHVGDIDGEEFPPRIPGPTDVLPVDVEEGYDQLSQTGFMYAGIFRCLDKMSRRRNYGVSRSSWARDGLQSNYTVHPAILDASFQTILHTNRDPSTTRLHTPLLPSGIKRVIINPRSMIEESEGLFTTTNETFVTSRDSLRITGDVYINDVVSGESVLGVEGLSLVPLEPPIKANDRQMFYRTELVQDPSLGLIQPQHVDEHDTERRKELAEDCERLVIYYVRQIIGGLSTSDTKALSWHHKRQVECFSIWLEHVNEEQHHPWAKRQWLDDGDQNIAKILTKWPDVVGIECIRTVGESFLSVLQGRTDMLGVLMKNNLLDRLYSNDASLHVLNTAMANVVQQVSRKFPRAKYLEIGAGLGSTTQYILESIGHAFDTYTYTDISPGFFENAADKFSEFSGVMDFMVLDIEKEPTDQGLPKHAYDVVIASNVLHATANLTSTLTHVRSLLKPGGFLLLIELTGTAVLRPSFYMGGLPGWWRGQDDGREHHPGVTSEEWHRRLQATGFSGVDVVFHDLPDIQQHCMSFLAAQAVDEEILQLQDPLTCSLTQSPNSEGQSLLIIGGKTLAVTKVLSAVQRLISNSSVYQKHLISVVPDVKDIDPATLSPRTDVLSLQELDGPLLLEPVSEARLKALQALFLGTHNVLWVTKGRKAENPSANMMPGMARALCKELPHLRFQSLDLDSIEKSFAVGQILVEALLRSKLISIRDDRQPLTWVWEPDLLVQDSDIFVLRTRPDRELNERYNSRFRSITTTQLPPDGCIRLSGDPKTPRLLAGDPNAFVKSDADEFVRVRVRHSLSIPAGKRGPCVHILLGTLVDSNAVTLAVSPNAASVLDVRCSDMIEIGQGDCTPAPSMLQLVSEQIIARVTCETTHAGSILLYNPSESLAAAVAAYQVQSCNHPRLICACDSVGQHYRPLEWIRIHRRHSALAIQALLPNDVKLFIDCGGDAGERIGNALPPECRIYQLNSDLFDESLTGIPVKELLTITCTTIRSQCVHIPSSCELDTFKVQDYSTVNPSLTKSLHIIDWEVTGPLNLLIQPPDATTLFDSGKTYLMVGMSGGLGLSICEWAVDHGARNLVITSRNPSIDGQWLASAQRKGARIHVCPMDVTNRDSIMSTVEKIRQELPPVGGVCNAAMVLSDRMFVDMDPESFNAAMGPKVDGSRYLDEIFAYTQLDFFILLSSLAAVVGTEGQTNYHAANMFMAGLAAQRRQRGLTGSVVFVGVVGDVGYLKTRGSSAKEFMARQRLPLISEVDVHHAMAEAIFAGKPGNSHSCEIGLGIDPFDKSSLDEDQLPVWVTEPRFSHYLPSYPKSMQEKKANRRVLDSKRQLNQATPEAERLAVIQEVFCMKLQTMMRLPDSSIDIYMSPTELGMDSLMAVEIRAWFLKEMSVDIPVTKLLGRETISNICIHANKQMLTEASPEKSPDSADPVPRLPMASPEGSSTNSSSSLESSTPVSGQSGSLSPLTNTQPESPSSFDKNDDAGRSERQNSDGEFLTRSASPTAARETNFIQTELLSIPQSRVYTHSKLVEDPAAYSLVIQYELDGELDIMRLKHALERTMQRHESLRTCFFSRSQDEKPMQGILERPVISFKYNPRATAADLARERKAAENKVWDIEHGETLGLTVVSTQPEKHTLLLAYHHLIIDATGMRTFIRDLEASYSMQEPLPKSEGGTYIEYTRKQLSDQQPGKLASELQYWRQVYSSVPEPLPLLPMAKTKVRPGLHKGSGTTHVRRDVGAETGNKIKHTCQSLGITAFHFHLATYQILLMRLLGVTDICIGVADANRRDDHYINTVGFFLNLLPIRFQVKMEATFNDLAQTTRQEALRALENSSVPFDMIIDSLNIPRASTHSPLFQAFLDYRAGVVKQMPFGSRGSLALVDGTDATHPYDMALGMLEFGSDGFLLEMICPAALYDEGVARSLLDTYLRIVEAVTTTEVSVPIGDIEIYDSVAVSQALQLGQGVQMKTSRDDTIPNMFEKSCEFFSDRRIAAVDGPIQLTYNQLRARVHSTVTAFQRSGCGLGSRIAMLCNPSVDSMVVMLAILHIGAVYIPLDPGALTNRHAAIVRSCRPNLLVSHGPTKSLVEQLKSHLGVHHPLAIALEDVNMSPSVEEVSAVTAKPDGLAVLLYTSGSTGRPKGVLLQHKGLAHWVTVVGNHFCLEGSNAFRILQQTALGFDLALAQTCCALCMGGTLVIVPEEQRRDPSAIAQIMCEHRINLTLATPSEYYRLLRYARETLKQCSAWRWAWAAGEHLHRNLKQEIQSLQLSGLSLSNLYGPTEVTIAATAHAVSPNACEEEEPENGSLIGKALPNYSICVVDSNCRPVPIEHQGEICVSGPGIAMGYWDLPHETAQKFISSFNNNGMNAFHDRWYRTGDKGRLCGDGNVVYLGRLDGDTEVKLRGFRIELGEIEQAIKNSRESASMLSEVVVTVLNEDALVAWATSTRPGTKIEPDLLLPQILGNLPLPPYMRPTRLIIIDDFPRTISGKIDRKTLSQLPLPDHYTSDDNNNSLTELPAKMSLRELELKLLWDQVLQPGLSRTLQPTSDFFLEGGNSLKLGKLQYHIKESMGVAIPTFDLYQASTIRQMTACIQSHRSIQAPDSAIDWEQEVAIPDRLLSATRGISSSAHTNTNTAVKRASRAGGIEVLLTGAGSFLGHSILEALLQNKTIRHIHCVALSTDEIDSLSPQFNSDNDDDGDDRIAMYPGSLTLPTLGLSPTEYMKFQSSIDIIIHAGAHGHCLNNYRSVREPNVRSTQFLIGLCIPHSIPFLFLSSNRVPLLSGNTTLPPVSVSLPPPSVGADGFTASKWVCEQFLERIAQESSSGLPLIEIHRPCVAVSDDAPGSDAGNAIVRFSTLLKATPVFPKAEGFLDFKSANDIARDIASRAIRMATALEAPKGSGSVGSIRFYHHSSGIKVPIDTLSERLQNIHGGMFQPIDIREWIPLALEAGMESLIATYMGGIIERGKSVQAAYLGEEATVKSSD